MASALDTIAHKVLPNFLKTKGASLIMSSMERRDTSMFQSIWDQCGVAHKPEVAAKEKDTWRFGVMSLPPPKEMGEAHMCAFVSKKADPSVTRFFTLEYDYVLATKTTRTVLCECEGGRANKLGPGTPVSGDFQTDSGVFIDAIMGLLEPKQPVDPNRNYR